MKWICDLDEQRLARFGRRYPGLRAQRPTFDDLLEDPELDAVVIATPVFTHFDLASRALERRQAHLRREAARAVDGDGRPSSCDARGSAGLVLMCGHTFLYSPPVRAVKGLLERDELGEVFFVSSSRVNLGLHQPDVSVIWDLGPHDFSILLYWLERDAAHGPGGRPRLDRRGDPRRRLRDA